MRVTSEPTDRSGARRPDSPSGVPHEGHKRADRSLGGSTLGLPSCALHESHMRADRSLGGSTLVLPFRMSFKATNKSTTSRQEIRVIDSLTLHSIDKSIKHRVGGY